MSRLEAMRAAGKVVLLVHPDVKADLQKCLDDFGASDVEIASEYGIVEGFSFVATPVGVFKPAVPASRPQSHGPRRHGKWWA